MQLRDKFRNGQLFDTRLEATVLTEDWRIDSNEKRSHGAHRCLTPSEFANAKKTSDQVQLA